MRKKKNAFTLIELLAVIVILAVILVIAIPRILDVIDESKLDSIKSSARMIINSAEKKNMIDKVNGSTEEVTCDNSVKLSKEDYESCKITIDEEGKATINLVGKGKFDGYKCIGTNDNLACGQVESITLPLNGKEYIEKLYSNELSRIENGLKKDNTSDQNIRYYGSNPNNYVSFNNELWRIIGVFGNNVKLIRSEKIGNLSWDSSEESINGGYGVNEWSQSDLKNYLNTMYYDGTTVTCFGGWKNTPTPCPTGTIDETSKSLIDYHTWNTGAIDVTDTTIVNQETGALNTVPFYKAERGSVNGKICNGGDYCNDTVTRKTEWPGYVGLPYVTDWAYASSESDCETNMNAGDIDFDNGIFNMTCKKNNWMHHGTTTDIEDATWVLSPFASPGYASGVWVVLGVGGVGDGNDATNPLSVFPTIYLKSNILIESGTGTSSNPYILKAGS